MTNSVTQPLPPPNSLRAFEATARHLSFSKAALELHVTPAALSHQIAGLEKRLGVKLLERKVRGIEFTDSGRLIYPGIHAAFAAIAAALQPLDGGGARSGAAAARCQRTNPSRASIRKPRKISCASFLGLVNPTKLLITGHRGVCGEPPIALRCKLSTLFESVKTTIRDRLEAQIYRPGDKIASETALVKELGVSAITVRRALRLRLAAKSVGTGEGATWLELASKWQRLAKEVSDLPTQRPSAQISGERSRPKPRLNPESQSLCNPGAGIGRLSQVGR